MKKEEIEDIIVTIPPVKYSKRGSIVQGISTGIANLITNFSSTIN
jgi:hypothetical protein